jgi:hypothetical protein
MNNEQKYLISSFATVLALAGTAFLGGWPEGWSTWKLIILLSVLVAIYGLAFLVQRWYGRALVVLFLLVKAPLSLVVGLACGFTDNGKVVGLCACLVGILPVLVMVLAFVAHAQGFTPANWPRRGSLVPMAFFCGGFWFVSTLYVQAVVAGTRRRQG